MSINRAEIIIVISTVLLYIILSVLKLDQCKLAAGEAGIVPAEGGGCTMSS